MPNNNQDQIWKSNTREKIVKHFLSPLVPFFMTIIPFYDL